MNLRPKSFPMRDYQASLQLSGPAGREVIYYSEVVKQNKTQESLAEEPTKTTGQNTTIRHFPSHSHGLIFLLEAAYLDPSWMEGCGGWFLVSKMSLKRLGRKERAWGYHLLSISIGFLLHTVTDLGSSV